MTDSTSYKFNNDISEVIELLISQYNAQVRQQAAHDRFNGAKMLMSCVRALPLVRWVFPPSLKKQQAVQRLLDERDSATTYIKWKEKSVQLDELMGNNAWKLNPESKYYDFELINNIILEMRDAREQNDYKLLLYLIRTKWVRNAGNIGDVSLYKLSFVGTKQLIEDYITECKTALDYLVNDTKVNLDDGYLLGMLIQTRKNIGRTALVLSGGSTFGMFHIGVLVLLLEVNLLPRIISGSSAGSIIAAILCCHNNEENKIIIESLSDREFEIFNSNDPNDKTNEKRNQFRTLLKSVGHFLKYGTIFEMEGLKNTIMGFVGNLTFREAYNRTGKILNITVSPASLHEQTRLLNYLTAPNCCIWSAVCASCSLPGVFPSTSIYEKNPRTNKIQKWNGDSSIKFVDGSVDNDLPITRLLEMFNVDHIIAVQVNPHVVPFLKISVTNPGGLVEDDYIFKLKGMLNNVYDFFTSELIHYLLILSEMDIYKNLLTKFISLLSQSYSGDITILPDFYISDFKKIFVNPTPEFISDFIIRGARSTWPKITIINNHCGVEFELDRAITVLRGRTLSGTKSSKDQLVVNPINSVEDFDVIPTSQRSAKSLETPAKSPITPKRLVSLVKHTPKIQRHNSSSGYNSTSGKVGRKQRNSISNFQTMKSTTALSSMGNITPYIRKDKDDKLTDKSEKSAIRKARSSGNFEPKSTDHSHLPYQGKLRYQNERVPYFDNNPYADMHVADPDFDSDYDESSSPEKISSYLPMIDPQHQLNFNDYIDYSKTSKSEHDGKANLPKKSQNNSMTNSYIGLNRLKDADLSRIPNFMHDTNTAPKTDFTTEERSED